MKGLAKDDWVVKFSMKKFLSLGAMIFIVALFTGCLQSYRTIDQNDAQKILSGKKDYILLDVRTKMEYDKRHIPNAILLPIEEIKQGNVSALPDKKQKILIYCWTGRRAEDSAEILTKLGYNNIYVFGGIVDWTGDLEGTEVE